MLSPCQNSAIYLVRIIILFAVAIMAKESSLRTAKCTAHWVELLLFWWWRRAENTQSTWRQGGTRKNILSYIIECVGGWYQPQQITSTPFILLKAVLSHHDVLTVRLSCTDKRVLKRNFSRQKVCDTGLLISSL